MTRDDILALQRSYQPACVLAAAADLDIFAALRGGALAAADLAARRGLGPRGTEVLLDALTALGLLSKAGALYAVPDEVAAALSGDGPGSVLAMAQHQANCLRRWAQLARVVATGRPAERAPSVRGETADQEAFIGAMDDISASVADEVVRDLARLRFRHVLDVGGASGTWTIAILRLAPDARATLFDLPHVIPLAERRLVAAGLLDRVRLVAGSFLSDPLPRGADLAWVSAIVHQSSRDENRDLFRNVHAALEPGGTIAIRDIVMEPSRTAPVAGALFAVNMLVGTEGGGTFTLDELREDLEASGFADVDLLRRDPGMSSIVAARKP